MSGAYSDFARFYDKLQKDVPYGEIAALIHSFINKYGSEHEVIAELACGTGSLSMELAKLGYDVYGIDLSQDMLNEAFEKKYDSGMENLTYLCQDMTELDLYGAADAIVCVLDSINHLGSFEEVEKTFERASMFVCEGGLFIFDVNTLYKHRKILGDNAFNFDMEGLFCCWQNELRDDDGVNIYLDFFEEESDGRYSRYSENFTEMYFELSDMEKSLLKNNFDIIGIYDGFSENPVKKDSQRALYVCRKK